MRVGQGYDVHRLVPGRPLYLGGVEIAHDRGLEGHSDGDALLHAVSDAILGALGEGDLGRHFPAHDARWQGVASQEILAEVVALMRSRNCQVANLDTTLIAEAPRLALHQAAIRSRVAEVVGVAEERVNIKVTSTDGLGAVGRGEGIAALAIVLLAEKKD